MSEFLEENKQIAGVLYPDNKYLFLQKGDKKMNNSSLTTRLILGAVLGAAAAALAFLGNPANMALCIACFIRDTAGSMKMHSAAVV